MTLECPSSFVLCPSSSVYTLEATLLIQTSSNLVSMIVMIISWTSLIMDGLEKKRRSLGQFLEESCLHSRCHIFGPIFLKLAQNVCLDNILVRFDHRLAWVKKLVTRSNLRRILFTL